jgi:hypothetical protein
VATPLPNTVPDLGNTRVGFATCNPTSGAFTIAALDATETGSNRNCSAAGVTNPEYPGKPGCLFGPPLPIPNPLSPNTSTCVVNRVTTSASGSGTCQDGAVALLNLPLASDIYLSGDLLTDVEGVQPCPICSAGKCQGGPRNGLDCVPGSSALGTAYPTSHDCPPAAGSIVGTLPIPFALSTATSQKESLDLPGQSRVFCGFCGDTFASNFESPPRACTADSQCTNPTFPTCKQRAPGAFTVGNARTISLTGSASGTCLADGASHPTTLVSVFCIPPSYDPTVDSVGNLPGPGAVTLPGAAQLLP